MGAKPLERFRFHDENDYEYEILSIVSSARAWTSVILAGKRGSRRHFTTSFTELNVRNFSILQSGEVFTSFNNDDSAYFSGEKKYIEEFRSGFFWQYEKKV